MRANYKDPPSPSHTMRSGICYLNFSIYLHCQDSLTTG